MNGIKHIEKTLAAQTALGKEIVSKNGEIVLDALFENNEKLKKVSDAYRNHLLALAEEEDGGTLDSLGFEEEGNPLTQTVLNSLRAVAKENNINLDNIPKETVGKAIEMVLEPIRRISLDNINAVGLTQMIPTLATINIATFFSANINELVAPLASSQKVGGNSLYFKAYNIIPQTSNERRGIKAQTPLTNRNIGKRFAILSNVAETSYVTGTKEYTLTIKNKDTDTTGAKLERAGVEITINGVSATDEEISLYIQDINATSSKATFTTKEEISKTLGNVAIEVNYDNGTIKATFDRDDLITATKGEISISAEANLLREKGGLDKIVGKIELSLEDANYLGKFITLAFDVSTLDAKTMLVSLSKNVVPLLMKTAVEKISQEIKQIILEKARTFIKPVKELDISGSNNYAKYGELYAPVIATLNSIASEIKQKSLMSGGIVVYGGQLLIDIVSALSTQADNSVKMFNTSDSNVIYTIGLVKGITMKFDPNYDEKFRGNNEYAQSIDIFGVPTEANLRAVCFDMPIPISLDNIVSGKIGETTTVVSGAIITAANQFLHSRYLAARLYIKK